MALITIAIYIYSISNSYQLPITVLLYQYLILFLIQVIALVLGSVLSLGIACLLDKTNRSMSWFTETWLLAGLFFAPMFTTMSAIPASYLYKNQKIDYNLAKHSNSNMVNNLPLIVRVQLLINGHCLILIILTIILMIIGIRSTFNCVISLGFCTISLIVMIPRKCNYQQHLFVFVMMVTQLLPFIYYTSSTQSMYSTMLPMMGRSGVNLNVDILMGIIAIFSAMFSVGPIVSHPKLSISNLINY